MLQNRLSQRKFLRGMATIAAVAALPAVADNGYARAGQDLGWHTVTFETITITNVMAGDSVTIDPVRWRHLAFTQ